MQQVGGEVDQHLSTHWLVAVHVARETHLLQQQRCIDVGPFASWHFDFYHWFQQFPLLVDIVTDTEANYTLAQ